MSQSRSRGRGTRRRDSSAKRQKKACSPTRPIYLVLAATMLCLFGLGALVSAVVLDGTDESEEVLQTRIVPDEGRVWR